MGELTSENKIKNFARDKPAARAASTASTSSASAACLVPNTGQKERSNGSNADKKNSPLHRSNTVGATSQPSLLVYLVICDSG